MKSVGIKKLKDNLSKYLKLVREGEIVWVTDRDEVIAEIHSPTTPIPDKISAWDAFISAEVRKGRILKATNQQPPSLNQINRKNSAINLDIKKLMDDIRADRDLL